LRVWRGKERKAWEKGMSKWKKYIKMGGESFGMLTFLHNTKPSSFRELKNCIGGGI